MLAIKLYGTMPSDDENVIKGISPKIPVMVIDLDLFSNYQIDDTFIQMTNQQYQDYLFSIKVELEEWRAIQGQT